MTEFATEIAILLFGTYVVGCAVGCWLRRSFTRKSAR